ncbi:nicotinate phosphoribosyltransferase, partial [Myxococcota bacterium]|nr:nicotinate phosphoribosyltransferase [Myxococcota bacterium]
ESWNRRRYPSPDRDEGRRRLAAKIARINAVADPDFRIADYGTRRRHGRDWQEEVVATLKAGIGPKFVGTSNVDLARRHDLTPLGTMAHEYLQTFQALGTVRLRDHQKAALEAWVQEYRGDLGIALTDVVGMDAFLADFDLYFAKLFDGLRHDSGDPVAWGEKALAHYARLRVDAHTKRLVFSDSLNLPLAFELYRRFADRTQTGFGIGTNLTNDMGGPTLHIVMKLTQCNGQPVAKLSDSPGKVLCDDQTFLAYLKQVFHLPAGHPG